ncbi:MAG: hypothetical protein QG591_2658, partial [Planctomycetota bacterium]|nr:hypothetical protein [Planctomycetota bacterium]
NINRENASRYNVPQKCILTTGLEKPKLFTQKKPQPNTNYSIATRNFRIIPAFVINLS